MQGIRLSSWMFFSAVLIGCQSTSEPTATPENTAGTCNATAVQKLVGKQASPALLDQARIESGAATARLLRPGDIVTQEYDAQRLSLTADESLEIQRVTCG